MTSLALLNVPVFILIVFSDTAAVSGETNTMCPTNTGMSDAVRMRFLNAHNQYRSSLARGRERDPFIGFAPKASKMLKMVYDCEVEAEAIKVAQRCVFAHSHGRFGENLFTTTYTRMDKISAATMACELWWKELRNGVGSYLTLTRELWARIVGHYTQMAWETSYRLGCAVLHCPTSILVVCQYGPKGNWMGSQIYTTGDPCQTNDDCPGKYTCSAAEALCNVVM